MEFSRCAYRRTHGVRGLLGAQFGGPVVGVGIAGRLRRPRLPQAGKRGLFAPFLGAGIGAPKPAKSQTSSDTHLPIAEVARRPRQDRPGVACSAKMAKTGAVTDGKVHADPKRQGCKIRVRSAD